MSAVDTLLALIRLERRLGYNATQLGVWERFDRCCHFRSVIAPRPLW